MAACCRRLQGMLSSTDQLRVPLSEFSPPSGLTCTATVAGRQPVACTDSVVTGKTCVTACWRTVNFITGCSRRLAAPVHPCCCCSSDLLARCAGWALQVGLSPSSCQPGRRSCTRQVRHEQRGAACCGLSPAQYRAHGPQQHRCRAARRCCAVCEGGCSRAHL